MLSPDHLVLLVLVLLLALVVFGPKRLPELGNSLGRAIQEFRHATQAAGEELRTVTTLPAAPEAPPPPGSVPPASTPVADVSISAEHPDGISQ